MNREIALLAQEFSLQPSHAENIVRLLDDGNTVPFIARYRKEMIGACDDQVLREVAARLEYLRNLQKRREEITAQLTAQGNWSGALAEAVDRAATLAELEDLYRPFRPKRRTRASVAREKGLQPLADALLAQNPGADPGRLAGETGLPEEEALGGACDILAEQIAEDASLRKRLREGYFREGLLCSKGATEEDSVYRQYYDYTEPLKKIPSHRILAVNRGEKEEKLKVSLVWDDAEDTVVKAFVRGNCPCSALVRAAATDSWKRLLEPSMERELRAELTDRANQQAIHTFGANLRPLLLQPPLKGKTVLAVDPGYRTGCKICVVDPTGKVLDVGVIYPTSPRRDTAGAAQLLRQWIERYRVDCFSVGNGTASAEAEAFVGELVGEYGGRLSYAVVSEAGASVYSASKLGAEEFPEFDVSVRSAVSIARRLQDPLAELVKIDPKAIGVGQYQHDMPPARLDETLRGVVEDCVNRVGVDLNTASPSLLSYVAGISAAVARNIALYREEHGAFRNRRQLLKVPKLGPRAFEQCAGFLRIPGGENLLDNTGVHPESYPAAEALLGILGFSLKDAGGGGLTGRLSTAARDFGKPKLAELCGVGLPTLEDILLELEKPGRDIRDALSPPVLRSGAMELKDLQPGMMLQGTVRNVTDFGAFVDVGVHRDGLVHLSQLSDRYVKHPSEVVKVGDVVSVRVLKVDLVKNQLALSMRTEKAGG